MPLDARVRRFLDLLAATQPASAALQSVAERRASVAELMKFSQPAAPVGRVEEREIPAPDHALGSRIYTPEGAHSEPLPGLVYFHGGGLVAGSAATHDAIARALAAAGGCRVVSIDYRLAPEHPFPAALEDAEAAVAYVSAHSPEFAIDPARLGVCGDSAGAALAAVVGQASARSGFPRIALQVLLCPITDYGARVDELPETSSRRTFASGYLVDAATLEHDLAHYLFGGADARDPRISPLRAVHLAATCPTYIHTAEFDPLRDEGRAYAERLAAGGTRVSYTCHPGMIHLFYGLGGVIPYARTAFAQIGREIRTAFA
jgi:acetyl esterase/lipase